MLDCNPYSRKLLTALASRSVQMISIGAPWILVESHDKLYARIKVLRSICETLEERLEGP